MATVLCCNALCVLLCCNLGSVLFQSKDIQSFSSDPRILAFAEQFCTSTNSKVSFFKNVNDEVSFSLFCFSGCWLE